MFAGTFEKLSKYFDGLPGNSGVEIAYLFGSVAKEKSRSKSDVDVSVLFSVGLLQEERLDKQLMIAGEMSSFIGQEVDVVDLTSAPLLLQHQVLKYGKCVFERDPQTRVAFEVAFRRNYFDMKPVWDLHTAGTMEKDREVLTRLLKLLEEYLHDLRDAQQTTWDEFTDKQSDTAIYREDLATGHRELSGHWQPHYF